jgi:hypothetical protein
MAGSLEGQRQHHPHRNNRPDEGLQQRGQFGRCTADTCAYHFLLLGSGWHPTRRVTACGDPLDDLSERSRPLHWGLDAMNAHHERQVNWLFQVGTVWRCSTARAHMPMHREQRRDPGTVRFRTAARDPTGAAPRVQGAVGNDRAGPRRHCRYLIDCGREDRGSRGTRGRAGRGRRTPTMRKRSRWPGRAGRARSSRTIGRRPKGSRAQRPQCVKAAASWSPPGRGGRTGNLRYRRGRIDSGPRFLLARRGAVQHARYSPIVPAARIDQGVRR